jgi:hypothetical protein
MESLPRKTLSDGILQTMKCLVDIVLLISVGSHDELKCQPGNFAPFQGYFGM